MNHFEDINLSLIHTFYDYGANPTTSKTKSALPRRANKKKTFKMYGKNTARGLRIKQDQMEKKAAKRKAEGDNYLVKGQMEHSKTKGKYSGWCR